jgi:hypothetical protein
VKTAEAIAKVLASNVGTAGVSFEILSNPEFLSEVIVTLLVEVLPCNCMWSCIYVHMLVLCRINDATLCRPHRARQYTT